MQLMPYLSAFFIIALALYGPSYEFDDLKTGFAPKLLALLGSQFVVAFTAMVIFNTNSTMLIDSFPNSVAVAIVTNNIC